MVSPAAFPPSSLNAVRTVVVHRLRSTARVARWRPSPQQAYLWGLGLGSFTLGLVNGALVISAGVGVIAYQQFKQLSPSQWQALRQRIQGSLPLPHSTPQQALALSLLLATSTYTMTSLWQSTHSLLMGLLLSGQTALTFWVVVGLLRSPATPASSPYPRKRAEAEPTGGTDSAVHAPKLGFTPGNPAPTAIAPIESPVEIPVESPIESVVDRFEQSLAHLTHSDPLKRLIAVRHLVRLVREFSADQAYGAGGDGSMEAHLIDCFHMMLAYEPESIVRSAVRESLAQLRQSHQLPAGPAPLPSVDTPETALPTQTLEQEPVKPARLGRRSAVEYVEYLEL